MKLDETDLRVLREAASDFLYLLDRGYPRERSLELVGNRYRLASIKRDILRRGVFPTGVGKKRMEKKIDPFGLKGKDLVVDGHNVLITVESALKGRIIVAANDGWVRDVAGVSSRYQLGEDGKRALNLILEELALLAPEHVKILYDAPIARSGELAAETRIAAGNMDLGLEAEAVRVPEAEMVGHNGPVASSDSAVIDASKEAVDLAWHVISKRIKTVIPLKLV